MLAVLILAGALAASPTPTDAVDFHPILAIPECTANEHLCANYKCIPKTKVCDNFKDCVDGSDEHNCDVHLCREPEFFRCNNTRCISHSFVCDGENDCEDFSDERNCSNFAQNFHMSTNCTGDEWRCSDNLCIPKQWVCNEEIDCPDGSDETLGCSLNLKCDDGFKCKNNHCIVKEWRCDGNNDCQDNSDEEGCDTHIDPKDCTLTMGRFLCADKNRTCLNSTDLVCDGRAHCPDGSDEGGKCRSLANNCTTFDCLHECVQLPTGPACVCPKGHVQVDEKLCRDRNECEIFGICDQKCRNTPGSYECYCDKNYALQSDKRTCKAAIPGDATLFFSSKSEIRTYLLNADLYYSVAKNLKQVVGVAYDGEYVYWTNIFSEHESIVRARKDGSEKELLVTSGLGAPEDLDVDLVTGNIYFTDAEMKHIGVCTNDGSRCTVLVNKDIHKPRGIALHPEEGRMYWTDWGDKPEIARAQMDGSKDIAFVSNDIHWPNGLAIDIPNERLYWTDAKLMTLESIRLDGTDRRIILEGVVRHPYAIAVFEDRLYWSDWATHSIQSCDKFTGKHHQTLIKEKRDYIYGITVFHQNLRGRKNKKNPCARSLCSDICLLTSATEYACACPQNKELTFDGRTCRMTAGVKRQLLILAADNLIVKMEHLFLGKHDVAVLPVVVKSVGALAYNSIANVLYVSDAVAKKIVGLNLHSEVAGPVVTEGVGTIVAMDFDYVGNNLYWCDKDSNVVEVLNLNTMSRKVLLHDSEEPESIALVPEEGLMFVAFTKTNRRETVIDRFNMDGTGRIHLLHPGLVGPVSLRYDTDLHKIFVADAGSGNIEIMNVEGDDRYGFRSLQTTPVSITTLKTEVFWVNMFSKRVYWANKLNQENIYNKKITLDIPENVKEMRIISATPRKREDINSPCQQDNGECSHLCLPSRGNFVCACPSGMILTENDNKTCAKITKCNTSKEFLCKHSNVCVSKETLCNGVKNCPLGEDEKDCGAQKRCASGDFQCQDGECISTVLRCDSKFDCKDKSDERNCSIGSTGSSHGNNSSHVTTNNNKRKCPDRHFSCDNGVCISQTFVCDGRHDCADGEDEMRCGLSSCAPDQFRCDVGSCIPQEWECDHEYDCADLSDEHYGCGTCPAVMFQCRNGRCLDTHFVCNHQDDCGDNSDETSTACQQHQLSSTSTLTGDSDNNKNCQFRCTSNSSICLPETSKCNGIEECPHKEDEQNCSTCHVEEFECKNKRTCIPNEWLCDNTEDCGDGSDESPDLCAHHNNGDGNNSTMRSTGGMQTPCDHGFRCKTTGDCLPLTKLCDTKLDCADGSDEGGACAKSCTNPDHNPCAQVCQKTPSGPACRCREGYKLTGDGYNCQDVDECHVDSSVCSQICVNTPGSYLCDCYRGFILRSDRMSCKAEGQAMSVIYTAENQIREASQTDNTLKLLYTLDAPQITGLDVIPLSPTKKHVYFSVETAGTLHRYDTSTKSMDYISDMGQPEKIACDWLTQNIYYVNSDRLAKYIGVCNFATKSCAPLIKVDVHSQISSLALDATNGFLFYGVINWFVFSHPSFAIYRTNLDGSAVVELVRKSAGHVTGMTFDPYKRQLFYTDQHQNQVNRINYDGSLDTTLAANLTSRPLGLNFFENHLYYLTSGGHMVKCRLFDPIKCEKSYRLHSYTTELFTIVQESTKPRRSSTSLLTAGENYHNSVCRNNSCASSSALCLPSQLMTYYRCLCESGDLVEPKEECPVRARDAIFDTKHPFLFNRNSNTASSNTQFSTTNTSSEDKTGSVTAAIMIPLCIVLIICAAYVFMRRRNTGSFNLGSIRFTNPMYGFSKGNHGDGDSDRHILEPEQHEYTNPMHFSVVDNADSHNTSGGGITSNMDRSGGNYGNEMSGGGGRHDNGRSNLLLVDV